MSDIRDTYRAWADVPPILQAAVNAYDAARTHGRNEPPMSDANKASIAPMIEAACLAAIHTAAGSPMWRHVKRGTTYVEVGRAELQMSFDLLTDGSELVVYRSTDGSGKLWAREVGEFEDGRFEAVK